MAQNLYDKTVVITGAANGIGYAIADNFLKKKARTIIIVDFNEEQGVEAVKTLKTKHGENRVEFMKCDVTTDSDFIQNIIETYNTVDVLVNSAGVYAEENIKKTIDINVTALIEWSLKFHNHMRMDKSGVGGTIINISSLLGYQVIPYTPIYQASKFAILGFTKSLGHEYNFTKFGVRVVAICPGFTDTNLVVNPKTYIPEVRIDLMKYMKGITFQTADAVGGAAVDVFEIAESGTVWEVNESKPIVLIP